jgi:ureidoglycolate lyase
MQNAPMERRPYSPTLGAARAVRAPVKAATPENLEAVGRLIDDPASFEIEIVRWPAQGWRPVDDNSGDQGGVAEGLFEIGWRGEALVGRNHAVGDAYEFGWSDWPERLVQARDGGAARRRERALVWRANYHPDGGQLIWPATMGTPFRVALARPGDDVRPDDFTAFRLDGRQGLYIPPNVWHGPFIPETDEAVFHDRQGRVHARVSVDFVKEFGCYLEIPL